MQKTKIGKFLISEYYSEVFSVFLTEERGRKIIGISVLYISEKELHIVFTFEQ